MLYSRDWMHGVANGSFMQLQQFALASNWYLRTVLLIIYDYLVATRSFIVGDHVSTTPP